MIFLTGEVGLGWFCHKPEFSILIASNYSVSLSAFSPLAPLMQIEIQDFHAFTRDSNVLKDSLQTQDSSELAAVAQ